MTLSFIFFRDGRVRAGWRLLIFLVVLIGISFAISRGVRLTGLRFARTAAEMETQTYRILLLRQFLALPALFLATYFMTRWIDGRPFRSAGLHLHRTWGRQLWFGFWLGSVLISVVFGAIYLGRGFSIEAVVMGGGALVVALLVNLVFFLMVGVTEEFLFRGYFLQVLSGGVGFAAAVAISSLLFGLGHFFGPRQNLLGAVNAGLVGALFCLMVYRARSLWIPIGAHAGWNFCESWLWSVPDSSYMFPGHLLKVGIHGPQWLTGGSDGPEGSVVTCLVLVLAAVFVWRARRFEGEPESHEMWNRFVSAHVGAGLQAAPNRASPQIGQAEACPYGIGWLRSGRQILQGMNPAFLASSAVENSMRLRGAIFCAQVHAAT